MTDLIRPGRRFLRAAGVSAWVLSGIPATLMVLGWLQVGGEALTLTWSRFFLWLGAALAFGAAFWLTSGAAGVRKPPRWARWLLLLQTIAALAMYHLVCTGLETTLLVVVAAQLGLFVAVPVGLVWVGLQTAALGLLGVHHWGLGWSLGWVGVFALPMSVLAVFTSYFAASQARARHDLARANAELEATRELLASNRQLAERARISRELHDLLGHHLTALSLNLEAARHQTAGEARTQIDRCRDLVRRLLGDLRQVVRALTGEETTDLQRVLGPLVADIPHPRVHLDIPPGLRVEDGARAHTIVRCVQEMVTNAVRHSGARNLWLEVSQHEDRLAVRARDDGRGSGEVVAGQGLSGMQQRLDRFGGRLTYGPSPEGGFEIRAEIPLAPGSPHSGQLPSGAEP